MVSLHTIVWLQTTGAPAMTFVYFRPSPPPVIQYCDVAVLVLILAARFTAPTALTYPEPVSRYPSARFSAVYIRIAFTAFGVRPGFSSRIRAATPETTAVAMLVPLS